MTPTCFYGPHEVDPSASDSRQLVVGWVRKHTRNAGATADVTLRETKDEWACGNCMRRMDLGLSLEQESLL